MSKKIFLIISISLVVIEVIMLGYYKFYSYKSMHTKVNEIESFPPNCYYKHKFRGGHVTEMEYNNMDCFWPAYMMEQTSYNFVQMNKGCSFIPEIGIKYKDIENAIIECKDKSFIHSNNKRQFSKDTLLSYSLDELGVDDYRSVQVTKCTEHYYCVAIETVDRRDYKIFFDEHGATVAIKEGEGYDEYEKYQANRYIY